jgi:hypothetical protein
MMISKYSKTFLAGVACILAIFVSSCIFGRGGGRGERLEAWETAKGNFKIRVSQYAEKNPVFLTHFFFVFESATVGSGGWFEFMTVKNDSSIPVPREQIRFVSDEIAYVFMNEKYAVTTDLGRTWTVWEAIPRNLSQLQSAANIRDVQINVDGTGNMHLGSLLNGQITSLTVSTKDYGHHWNSE